MRRSPSVMRGRGTVMSPTGSTSRRVRGRGRPPKSMLSISKMELLSNESKVEVSSDDEGFKGVWYTANIVKSTPTLRPPKRKNQVLVQYDDLLSDTDPNMPLIECVDSCYIRPVPPPPPPHQTYEPHDVVDAFHNDGWWKGVVTHVQLSDENKTTYNVVFETPPELFTFSSQHLRFHLDWTHGQWVQPPKQMRMKGLEICKGMAVEVNLKDAWFPASVVDEVGFNSFLVEYDHNHMEEVIDSFHVRYLPPKLEVHKFEILELVDAFHDSCWSRASIAKILTDGRYVLILKSQDKEIELSHSEIRPHLLWNNGRWFSLSREVPNIAQSAHVDNNAEHSEVKSYVRKLSKKSTPLRTNSTSNKLNKTPPERVEETLASYSKKLRMENSPKESHPISMLLNSAEQDTGSVCESEGNLPVAGSNQQEAGQENGKAESSKMERVLNAQVMSQQVPAAVVDDKKNTDPAESDSFTHEEINMQKESNAFGQQDKAEQDIGSVCESGGNQHEAGQENGKAESPKSGSLLNAQVMSQQVPAAVVEDKRNTDADSDSLTHEEVNIQKESNAFEQQDKGEEQHNVFEGIASEMDIQDCGDPIADHTTKVGASCDAVNDDLAPSACLGNVENLDQSSVQASDELVEKQELPFTKTSSVWEYIDSLEVFKVLPQNPHFRPLLEEKNEATREGFAIGNMFNFAGLVEKTSKLKIDQPTSVFDSYLKALSDLEMHGFDVKALSNRISQLLPIKIREEEMKKDSQDLYNKIAEYDSHIAKLEGEIKELEEQLAMKMEQKAMKDSESNLLQKDVIRLKEEILNAKLDFVREAGAPW
ncbi:DUF724 domain-containing protein 2-like isoform X3 [Euphorbia lathyris]|uniref:DUF724 domain-containing protein 2-like isoform X3 n=1 Tax=Euphorbia lathyris TaxID=212925 RepID=UPI003313DD21